VQERVVREVRTLRAMWRALETGPRQLLTGHEEENLGCSAAIMSTFTSHWMLHYALRHGRIPVNGPDHCWYANGRARPYERYVLGDNTTLRDGTSQKSIRWVETA
jgi:hypothetical protein